MRYLARWAMMIAVVACVQPAVGNGDPPATDRESPPPPPGGGSSAQDRDWAEIERLEAEAKAIASATGCSSADGCRTAPVGNRACGGPRYYIVYCAATTDSAALFRKLDEVVRAENEYNRKHGLVSTCEFRMPPEVAWSGGQCRAEQ